MRTTYTSAQYTRVHKRKIKCTRVPPRSPVVSLNLLKLTNLGQLSLCYNNQNVNAASTYVQKYYEAFLSVLAPRVENASSSYY